MHGNHVLELWSVTIVIAYDPRDVNKYSIKENFLVFLSSPKSGDLHCMVSISQ